MAGWNILTKTSICNLFAQESQQASSRFRVQRTVCRDISRYASFGNNCLGRGASFSKCVNLRACVRIWGAAYGGGGVTPKAGEGGGGGGAATDTTRHLRTYTYKMYVYTLRVRLSRAPVLTGEPPIAILIFITTDLLYIPRASFYGRHIICTYLYVDIFVAAESGLITFITEQTRKRWLHHGDMSALRDRNLDGSTTYTRRGTLALQKLARCEKP